MRKFKILTLILFLQFVAFGQTKLLTVEDASGMNRALFPKTLRNLQWKGTSDYFTYIDNNSLLSGHVSSESRETILTLAKLNSLLKNLDSDTLKQFPSVTWLSSDKFMFSLQQRIFTFEPDTGSLVKVNAYPDKAANIDMDQNTLSVAYTLENNLYIAIDNQQIKVTNDHDKGIINGQAVHRNEFGINQGTFWSPKGNYLAFYRMDETMVTDYPLVNIASRPAELKNIKYPMAGMTSHQVTVGVFDPRTKETVFMKTGDPKEQYLTCVTWSPDEQSVYIALLNRDQNHLKLNQYDAQTGAFIQTLLEETDKEYVEPEHPLYFLNSRPDRFIWFSERDGYSHLYLYSTDGILIRQITDGSWNVSEFLGTDPSDEKVFYLSNELSPVQQHIYSKDLTSDVTRKYSKLKGTHSAILNKSGQYLIDINSSWSEHIANEYDLINNKGRIVQVLQDNSDPLKEYKLGETTVFTIRGRHSDDLYCRMIKPIDFDPSKKYPVFLYVYGGPHSQLVTDSWLAGAGLFLNYMAQQGYVVFTLDNRGTDNRGMSFEQAIFRNLGAAEVEDQMSGVEYLVTLDFVDPSRIGVNGWSYGGFMTISMMLRHPEAFKAGVCGGPVTDWKYYEVMYGERYMDTPETNPEGYRASSLLDMAGNLKGKLLLIHGTEDPTVVWQQSLDFIDQSVKAGVDVDYFVYPGHGHGVGGKDRVHLNQKIIDYFKENL
ncbi:MAG TPA: DPP IV N-terminal domain-containing protein [Bacteroidales bacterium]|nr:DPP IV N-terminal domain-containing protein [Bacteroidales bacterium]HNS45822.1 DPP IV N-terminal domain-containing protein [Bacteroidales bacterium]